MICDVAPEPHPTNPQRLLSRPFLLTMLAGFAYFLLVGSLIPVVPRYVEDELNGNGLDVGIAVGAFAVSAALLRPWIGRMGDTRGRRILVVGGGVVAGVSLLLYPIATSLPSLVAARLLTGVGEAAFFTGVMTANQDLAPDHRRGEATSYFSVAVYGGLAVGPAVGELVLRETNFTTVFLVFAGCGFVASLLGLGIPRGVTVEEVPERDLLHRAALGPGIMLALGLVPLVAYGAFLPLYADEVGMHDVGPALTVYAGLILAVRIVGARLPDRMGWRRASAASMSGAAAGMLILGLWQSTIAIWIGTVTLALGMSLLYPALFAAVMGITPESERSHAVGTFTLFFDLSSGLGAALVGAVVAISSERVGFVAAGLCAASGLVMQSALRNRIGTRPAVEPAT
ncbi:MAG: MFS transporter [Acidimicrobiales bacterium]